MSEKFKGLWPALFTPVDESGKVNVKELEKLIELLVSQQVDGLYLLGSTGQGFLFNENERKEIAKISLQMINKRVPVMVQVGALSTEESVRLAKHSFEMGADAISSVAAFYLLVGIILRFTAAKLFRNPVSRFIIKQTLNQDKS